MPRIKLQLSVTQFADHEPEYGDLVTHSSGGLDSDLGREAHFEALTQIEGYKEYPIQKTLTLLGVDLTLSGRIDCFNLTSSKITEVKAVHRSQDVYKAIQEDEFHPFRVQVMTYVWLLQQKGYDITGYELLLVDYRSQQTISMSQFGDIDKFETWLLERVRQLVLEERMRRRRIVRRKKLFTDVTPNLRANQKKMVEFASKTKGQTKLIQSPTGSGKTLAMIFSALRISRRAGRRLIWLTPKNKIQERVCEDLATSLPNAQVLTITSKEKICMQDTVDCDNCPFAVLFHTKMRKLKGRIRSQRTLDKSYFRRLADHFEVCPYYAQKVGLPWADVVIGDFNHVFALSSISGALNWSGREKNVLAIDEGHHLTHRVRDELGGELKPKKSLPRKLNQILEKFIKHQDPHLLSLGMSLIASIADEKDLEEELKEVYSTLVRFLVFSEIPQFKVLVSPNSARLLCLDPSPHIKRSLEQFSKVLVFSATLKPFDLTISSFGLEYEKTPFQEFPSVFPEHNRKILIIPQVSTKLRDRSVSRDKIVEIIDRLSQRKSGRYLVFAPSFKFCQELFETASAQIAYQCLCQERGMSFEDIESLRSEFVSSENAVLFAVQGSHFSEGIDLPSALGCFVVGPALPEFSKENQSIAEYYQQSGQNGFLNTYIQPAMIRSIQSAGRIIRSPEDIGLIVFIDQRFAQKDYWESFPSDWVGNSPQHSISSSILNDVDRFWSSHANPIL